MRKITQITIMAVFAITALTFTSCSNTDDNTNTEPAAPATPKTNTELLTANSWKLTSAMQNGQEVIGNFRKCIVDNLQIFKTDGSYILDEGATKCSANDPQTLRTETWKFTDNETVIELDNDKLKIQELTSTKFVYEADGLVYTVVPN